MAALFPLGRLVVTPGALALLAGAPEDPAELLARQNSSPGTSPVIGEKCHPRM
jgi:hypothetical protein